ncbi:MAG: hypothetical protein ABIS86_08250, partial [Streptosporangiaceae bacterium]
SLTPGKYCDGCGADVVGRGAGACSCAGGPTLPPPAEQAADAGPVENTGERAGKGEGRGPSQSTQLVKVGRDRFELFMSDDGRPYAVRKDGPNLALSLRGKAGLRSTLARIFAQEQSNTAASQSALADAMTVLEGFAQDAEPRVPHLRTARDSDRIVVDLGTPDGRCVVIGPEGWSREDRSPVLFRRSGAMRALPSPLRDGDGLARLAGLLNMDEQRFRLLVGWLVAAFIPDLPHPILTFRGEQGTGKSKSAQMVISIIDPSGAPKRTAPRDVKSWGVQAFNSWGLCLDNISHVPDWLSDALCRAVTGDGMVDRALYSDDDVIVLEFRRVLALTTIDAGALAGDLAERLLTIELDLIPDSERREEAELDKAYADAHAGILASLFDLLAEVLKALPDVVLTERPRMADFARILAAVDHVRGWDTLTAYKAGARDAISDVLDGDQFAQALVELVDGHKGQELSRTSAQILELITPDRPPKTWPKDATRAGGRIKRLAPALRAIGIEVDDTRRGPAPKRQRLLTLTATAERIAVTSKEPERRHDSASTASTHAENSSLTSAYGVDTGERPAASTPAGHQVVMDAGDTGMDTAARAASTPHTASDLPGYAGVDAVDAMDAGMQSVSDSGLDIDPHICTACGEYMPVIQPGHTTHPSC